MISFEDLKPQNIANSMLLQKKQYSEFLKMTGKHAHMSEQDAYKILDLE
jgi:hypothetical protein